MTQPKEFDKRDTAGWLNEVARNVQKRPVGQRVILEDDNGIAYEYYHPEEYARAKRFARVLDAEMKWIETFTSHAPSVGSHYESILRDLLAEYLPSTVKVGTGFVFDTMTNQCSPQIDILVYVDTERSPIHRRGEFVIVDANSVVGVCEVKKQLTLKDVRDCIRKSIGVNLGQSCYHPHGVQQLAIFAYHSSAKTTAMVKCVKESTQRFLNQLTTQTPEGNQCLVALFNFSPPAIYLRDRDEYIVATVKNQSSKAVVSIQVLTAGGESGISPLLVSLCPDGEHLRKSRDLISSDLIQVVSETPLDCPPIYLARRFTSLELAKIFPGDPALRRQRPNGERIVGAVISSFVKPSSYSSLESLSREPHFGWIWASTKPGQ